MHPDHLEFRRRDFLWWHLIRVSMVLLLVLGASCVLKLPLLRLLLFFRGQLMPDGACGLVRSVQLSIQGRALRNGWGVLLVVDGLGMIPLLGTKLAHSGK